ncbi:MAG: TOBE domain-containing protein [Stenomitos rutilans HA7619-LM2]|jgi:molybdopterin-binding protein|nr:TOBE domain-containing protein [Stenomitos rutilans HA7619-LM2]
MWISARNLLKGIVKKIEVGAANIEIILEITPGIEVTSIIKKSSAEKLGLSKGKIAYAVIKPAMA